MNERLNKIREERDEKDYKRLTELTYEGAERRYGTPIPKEVDDRIRYELQTIKDASSLLVTEFLRWHEYVNVARNELDSWVGTGFSSEPGSLVAYCLGVTGVDPLKHNLLFERFLTSDCIDKKQLSFYIHVEDSEVRKKLVLWIMDHYYKIESRIGDLLNIALQKETIKIIKKTRRVDIDLNNIPIDDEQTFQLYQEGKTTNLFQFQSATMQEHLRALRPTTFEELVALNALYRPGPMGKIPSFIDRKHGCEPITYPLPCMEPYLKETYGLMIYQEQLMLLAQHIADFTPSESDTLRLAIDKKTQETLNAMKPKFIEGGKKNGHDPVVLEEIWNDWVTNACFLFLKSHVVSFTWMDYQSAYLKAHYPIEYLAAVLHTTNERPEKYAKLMEEIGIDR